MRDPSLTNFLSHILVALEDISVPVDPALKETFERHKFWMNILGSYFS